MMEAVQLWWSGSQMVWWRQLVLKAIGFLKSHWIKTKAAESTFAVSAAVQSAHSIV
jgi:hypothetical protein